MKNFNLVTLFVLFHFVTFSQETWTVDNAHSNINFEVGWEDFSMRTGEFKVFEGTLTTNSREDLSNAVFELKVDPASLDVIAPNLSEHLKGEDFLNVENYPEITYHSSKAVANSDGTYTSKGKLKVHGVENDQDVLIKVKGYKETERSYVFGLEVSLSFNRSDYGLTWGSPRLGETATIVGHLLYQIRKESNE